MTNGVPDHDSLRRGDVVLASDPFADETDATRPWTVVNNEDHPFDGEQYVAMALTTRTWYDDRVPLGDQDFRRGRTPDGSSLVPHALASLQPHEISNYVCRLARDPIDEAVTYLLPYLVAGG